MDYREILKEHLKRRQQLNPRFSLRSFATKLGISASKVSEVFSGKKNLSVARLEDIAKKLNLKGIEKEIFLLSAELESKTFKKKSIQSSLSENSLELKTRLKKLVQDLNAEQTQQRNAWYFGAIKSLQDAGHDPIDYQKQLGLTTLQIENAVRFLKRIKRFHPERQDLTFEPISLTKKINETFQDTSGFLHADFILLTPDQVDELKFKIKSLMKKIKNDCRSIQANNLQMVHFGISEILKEN